MDAEHDPQGQADQQHNNQRREHQRGDVIALCRRTVQVQEIHQVNDHLNHGEQQHDRQRGHFRQGWVHHQPERNDGQDHRQDEADYVGLHAAVVRAVRMCVSHLQSPHQVNNGEYADPHHVQEVPEQAQAAQTGFVGRGQAVFLHLIHHDRHPDQTAGHVQTVGTHQGEEPGQEAAAARAVAFGDQDVELVDFHADEASTEQEGHAQPEQNLILLALEQRQHGEAVGDRAEQQQGSFTQHVRQLEDVVARRATRYVVNQYRVYREDRRKQDAVGHQVEPETKDGCLARVVMMVIVPMVMTMSVSSSGR